MGLSKEKLGQHIQRVERRNANLQYGFDDVRGMSNTKEIQPTKADISDRSFTRFQIVEPLEFVFNRRTTRMGEKIGLGYNNTGVSFIVTEDYVVFRVADADGMRIVRETLIDLNRNEGVTILISSHILGELSKIATHYGIIKGGRLIREMHESEMSQECKDFVLVKTNDNALSGGKRSDAGL